MMLFAGFDLLVSVSALIGLWIYVRLATAFFIKIRCPDLLGAVIAGVIIGQSGLGLSEALVGLGLHFNVLVKSAYWAGLIALMFVTGASLPRESDDKIGPAVTALVGGTLIALTLAFLTSGLISGNRYDAGVSQTTQGILAYQMILALAAVVTSVPFLSKIFHNVGMLNTYFAKRILASACVLDLILWNLVPVAEVTRHAGSLSIGSTIMSIALVTAFSILMIYYGPRLCKLVMETGRSSIWWTIVVVVAFCGAVVGLGILFGVHPMIAALLAGYCVGNTRSSIKEEFAIIEKFGTNNLVPLYFAIVGMSVHIVRDFNLGLILSFIIWSSALKIACVFLSAKLYFGDSAQSLHYAVAMNTRGGPGIALAGLALSLGLIGQPTFLALIFASFITAGVTEAWLVVFYRRSLPSVPSTNNPPAW